MPLTQNNGEPRGMRTMRVALLAGAVGSLIGGTIVVASVATVLSVINPQPKQTASAPKSPPPIETTGVATPAEPIVAADDKSDCANQTWPNIDQRCLKRVDDADRQTTASNETRVDDADRQTTASNVTPATAPSTTPTELQPGSPAVPTPAAVLPTQPVAVNAPPPGAALTQPVTTNPTPAAPTQQPPAAVSAQSTPPTAQPAPVAEAPVKKAAPAQPTRKTERARRPPPPTRHAEDDNEDRTAAPATSRRSRSEPDDVIEPAPRSRAIARRSIDDDDVVVERPHRPRQPFGFFGFLFGSDNYD